MAKRSVLRVLYLGALSGTSLHRRDGFKRIGCIVHSIDPRSTLPPCHLIDKIEWHLSPSALSIWVTKELVKITAAHRYDIAFVDNGSLISVMLIRFLKTRGIKVVNFNHDDPFGKRDKRRFSLYKKAVSEYDLVTIVRQENIKEAMALGARQVLYTFRVADEVAHCPRIIGIDLYEKWKADVSFIGTWMPERGPFLAKLVQAGLSVTIYGEGWQKSPEWPILARFHRGERLDGDDYAYAIQCSKVCLGLLSEGNRDRHTTRSMEIPSLGGLFCAQRTDEHAALYADGVEALLWDTPEECIEKCRIALADPELAERIRVNGRNRFVVNMNTTESLLQRIVDSVLTR